MENAKAMLTPERLNILQKAFEKQGKMQRLIR
jgi:hypothetical protein